MSERHSNRQAWRHWLRIIVQLIVSAALIVWVLRRVSWAEFFQTLLHTSPLFVILSAVCFYAGILISCVKWQALLAIEDVSAPLLRLVGWYLIGSFANNFLPTDIGGDVGRGFYASRAFGRPMVVVRSIFIERVTGLLMMCALAWVGLIVLLHQLALALLIAGGSLAAALIGWALLGRLSAHVPARLTPLIERARPIVHIYLQHPWMFGRVLLISLIFQVLAGLGTWLNFQAVHAALPILDVCLAAAMVSVTGVLPISVNGWGVKEALFISLLAPFGSTANMILAGVLLGRVIMLLGSLLGVIPWLLENRGGRSVSGEL